MRLDLTKAALADLRSIRVYTLEKWGPVQEERYLEALWEKFEELCANPGRFRFRHDLFPQCQIAAQGRHAILFRIHQDRLQIVRLLHRSMDFPRHIIRPKNG